MRKTSGWTPILFVVSLPIVTAIGLGSSLSARLASLVHANVKNNTILQGALYHIAYMVQGGGVYKVQGRGVYKVQGFENFSEKGRL